MPSLKLGLLVPALLGLAACTTVGPLPGTPEYLGARVSRAYDCGIRVDRNGVIARLGRDERPRFLAANAAFAVKSYKAPRSCDAVERANVQREVSTLARR
jgi:hypothetical protein